VKKKLNFVIFNNILFITKELKRFETCNRNPRDRQKLSVEWKTKLL